LHRAEYTAVTDEEALAAFRTLTRSEGIIPALNRAMRWRMPSSWRRPCRPNM